MQFSAVLFDIGGVVVGSPLWAIQEYEQLEGLPPGRINRHIVDSGPSGAWARLERGELTLEEFFPIFEKECRAAGQNVSARRMMQMIQAATLPRPEMLQAIRRIRSAGLRTAAVTNNWISEEQAFAPIAELFDLVVESARLGIRKPDPRIFTYACEQLGVAPSKTVFLDDIGRNLKTARALGMTTIKVDDPHAAIVALEELLGIALR